MSYILLKMASVSDQTPQASSAQSTNKPMKEVVQRMFYIDQRNERIFRIIAICYEYNRKSKTLKYGASIFYETKKPEEKFRNFNLKSIRSNIRTTAQTRFEKNPVVINNISDDQNLNVFHLKIRNLLHKNSVKNRNN